MFRRRLLGPGLLRLLVLIAPACNERSEQTSKAPSVQNNEELYMHGLLHQEIRFLAAW